MSLDFGYTRNDSELDGEVDKCTTKTARHCPQG